MKSKFLKSIFIFSFVFITNFAFNAENQQAGTNSNPVQNTEANNQNSVTNTDNLQFSKRFREYRMLLDLWKLGRTKNSSDFYTWHFRLKKINVLEPYFNFIENKKLTKNWSFLEAWAKINFWNRSSFENIWNPVNNPMFFELLTNPDFVKMSTDPMLHLLKLSIVSQCYLLQKPKPEINSHKLKMGLGGNWAKGNINRMNFQYQFLYERLINFWEIKINAYGLFYKELGETPDSVHTGSLTIGYNIDKKYLQILYYGEVGSENVRNIELFTNHGIGVKISLFGEGELKWFSLYFTLIPVFLTYTIPVSDLIESETKLDFSLSTTIKFWFDEGKKSSVACSFSYRPNWKTPKNYYINFKASLESSFAQSGNFNFSLSIIFDYKYYSHPIDPVIKNSDFRLMGAVNIYYKN